MLSLCVFIGCAPGRTAFDKALQLEKNGMYDEAVIKYAEAISKNPDMSEYRLRYLKSSETAANIHLQAGDKLFADGRYEEAFSEYQKAVALDASQERAKQQSELVVKYRNSRLAYEEGLVFEKDNKPKEAIRLYQKALNLNPNNTDAGTALEKLLKTRRVKAEAYELNLKSTKPITLKFKDAKIKDVFNIITQLSGINFVFDEAVKDVNVTIYLENATFQQALDIISGMHKLNRKVLNESTVIIFPKTADKVKQYEDLYVQTFFLNKLDAKKAVNLIRTMLQVKKIYVNEEMNTLVIRDTLDVIEVAGRILEANDVPDAEVVLEVEVIELSKSNTESFGLALSRYSIGYNTVGPSGNFLSDTLLTTSSAAVSGSSPNVNASGSATVVRADTSQLVNLFKWGDYSGFITVPNATFNFGKTLGNAETLSNPKIRVKNREKAKFNVGTRVPITTTSSNGVGNYNVNVQYVDVGVKLNAEPTIQINNEVNIKLGLEVSSILSTERVGSDGNTTVATIGTRNLDTVLSLKDGETSLIGGLIQDTKGQNSNKIFLLGDIPILGPLFSSHDNSGDKTELILAITPRIVRGIAVSSPEVASFWSGLEDDPSVSKQYNSFVQEPEFATVGTKPAKSPARDAVLPAPVPVPQLPVALPNQSKTAAPQQTDGQAVKEVPATEQTKPAAAASPSAVESPQQPVVPVVPVPPVPQEIQSPVPTPPVQAAQKISLKIVAPGSVKKNELFNVDIQVADALNLSSTPLTVIYDPSMLEALEVNEGGLLKQDGRKTNFTNKIDNNSGQLMVKISREDAAEGVAGAGSLCTIKFKAKSNGPASIGFVGVKLADARGKQLDSILYNAVVEIK